METITIPIKQLAHAKGLALPSYASSGAAGLDLCAAIEGEIELAPMVRIAVPTGIMIALPQGLEAQIRARSGLALKQGLAVLNAPGTIDSDYRGEIAVILINLGQEVIKIQRGMRIAQMVIAAYTNINWQETNGELAQTLRGGAGFGSTGLK